MKFWLLGVPGFFGFLVVLMLIFNSTALCAFVFFWTIRIMLILGVLKIYLVLRREYLRGKPKIPSARGPRPLISRENVVAFIRKSRDKS
jgi:hypothetical protein